MRHLDSSPHSDRYRRGFTIVELLIVIVVIGILAAVTIVAYNGISQRATASALQSSLAQANKKLELYMAENSAYPADLATFQSLLGSTGSTSFQYSVNNSASPKTYCVTATTGTTSYNSSSTATTAVSGGCPGHGVGGVSPVTNLVANPSVEVANSGFGCYPGNGTPSSTCSRQVGSAISGVAFHRLAWAASTASPSGGVYYGTGSQQPVSAGQAYTFSGYVRSSKSHTLQPSIEWYDISNVRIAMNSSSSIVVSPATWTRVSISASAPIGSVRAVLTVYALAPGSAWTSRDTLDMDGVMLTAGSTLYNYTDGSSPGWIWNGTANNSTSTGPPL
jgi:prepilin-type N-terminal cleavage/methylation domain-containing protein